MQAEYPAPPASPGFYSNSCHHRIVFPPFIRLPPGPMRVIGGLVHEWSVTLFTPGGALGEVPMRKYLYGLFSSVALTIVVAGTPAWAVKSIVGSGHDLNTLPSAITVAGNNGRICIFCHTPHNARSDGEAAAVPLWWRQAPVSTVWTMYDSSSMDATPAGAPQGVSMACLSCHDGATAFDALVYKGGITVTDAGGQPANMFDVPAGFILAVGPNLSDDHPISITYGLDPDFVPKSTAENAGLVFYGTGNDQVECATCHSVHDDTNGRFLRITMIRSELCLTCHVK